MTLKEQLASISLFQSLSPADLERLASIVISQRFSRGDIVFSEGEEGRGFYVVMEGRVKIFKASFDGKEQILHLFGPGEPFGEVAVFAGRTFPAYAEAMENSRVLYFPRTAFISLIQKNPLLAMNMLAMLSERLHRFARLIEDLSLKEVPGRVAAYLLYLSDKQGGTSDVVLDIAKGQLASVLGTIPETLSRMLTRMTQEKLIASDGSNKVRIEDRKGLEKLASGEIRLSKSAGQ